MREKKSSNSTKPSEFPILTIQDVCISTNIKRIGNDVPGFRKESAIRNDEVSQCILNGSINSVYVFSKFQAKYRSFFQHFSLHFFQPLFSSKKCLPSSYLEGLFNSTFIIIHTLLFRIILNTVMPEVQKFWGCRQ